jgi:hypothetical protein
MGKVVLFSRKSCCAHGPENQIQAERALGVFMILSKPSVPLIERTFKCRRCEEFFSECALLDPDDYYDDKWPEDAEGWPLDKDGKRLPILQGNGDGYEYW